MCKDSGWDFTQKGAEKQFIEEVLDELNFSQTRPSIENKAESIRTCIYKLERWMEEVYAKEKFGEDGKKDCDPDPMSDEDTRTIHIVDGYEEDGIKVKLDFELTIPTAD